MRLKGPTVLSSNRERPNWDSTSKPQSPDSGMKDQDDAHKASGAKLGNPSNIGEAGEMGRMILIEAADDHDRVLLPLLRTLRAAITIGAITRSLNERKIPTVRGFLWHVSSVGNLLARAQKRSGAPTAFYRRDFPRGVPASTITTPNSSRVCPPISLLAN